MDHSNLFHDALTKIHDIAKNGTGNTTAWSEVLNIVDGVLEEARRLDRQKFDKTYCSQCGREFGPGTSGYSHCDQHPR